MSKTLSRQKYEREKFATLERLLAFDRQQRFRGRSQKPQCILVGTDEVGRGCLAGPVVAAAVMLPDIEPNSAVAAALLELNDSKLLTPAQRQSLSKTIKEISLCEIAEASVQEINEINILQASLLAMRRALDQLAARLSNTLPILVLVDGDKQIKNIDQYIQTTVIQGDSSSASIAAASIVAKVYRDQLMTELSGQFPAYCWQQNKGYASPVHRAALRHHGMTIWHRDIFCHKHLHSGDVDQEIDYQIDDVLGEHEMNEKEPAMVTASGRSAKVRTRGNR